MTFEPVCSVSDGLEMPCSGSDFANKFCETSQESPPKGAPAKISIDDLWAKMNKPIAKPKKSRTDHSAIQSWLSAPSVRSSSSTTNNGTCKSPVGLTDAPGSDSFPNRIVTSRVPRIV